MPKTDIKNPQSDDVRELSDEALDRTGGGMLCVRIEICGGCNCGPSCYSCVLSASPTD
ncbi:MAG: hypothetical protein ISR48_04645 [Alphaproteobacteria bacterium]|nr:hypothetical protein [Alphaproteobacteria bacterium]